MEFLRHQIGGDVINPSNDNLEKVRKTPRPTTKKQVKSFLGLVGYYRDHIPAFAEISASLSDLLKKGMSEQVQWNEAQERAYSLLKEYLLQKPVLKLPDLMKLFVLRTDASGVGVAAVLLQENEGKLYPVGYASKKLSLAEAKYPIREKECLAVVCLTAKLVCALLLKYCYSTIGYDVICFTMRGYIRYIYIRYCIR